MVRNILQLNLCFFLLAFNFLLHLGYSGGLLGQLVLCDHYDGRFVALEFASMDFYSVLMQCCDLSDVLPEEVND